LAPVDCFLPQVALALKIYEDLKPKPLTQEEILRQQRPQLVQV